MEGWCGLGRVVHLDTKAEKKGFRVQAKVQISSVATLDLGPRDLMGPERILLKA